MYKCPPVPKNARPGPYFFGPAPRKLPGVPYRLLEWVDAELAVTPNKFAFNLSQSSAVGMLRVAAGLRVKLEQSRGSPDEHDLECALRAANICVLTGGGSRQFRKLFDSCQNAFELL